MKICNAYNYIHMHIIDEIEILITSIGIGHKTFQKR